MRPRIIVEASGGVITRITADQNVDVMVVDWDNVNDQIASKAEFTVNWWPVQIRLERVKQYAKAIKDSSELVNIKKKEETL